jgi:hypothetical protein
MFHHSYSSKMYSIISSLVDTLYVLHQYYQVLLLVHYKVYLYLYCNLLTSVARAEVVPGTWYLFLVCMILGVHCTLYSMIVVLSIGVQGTIVLQTSERVHCTCSITMHQQQIFRLQETHSIHLTASDTLVNLP